MYLISWQNIGEKNRYAELVSGEDFEGFLSTLYDTEQLIVTKMWEE